MAYRHDHNREDISNMQQQAYAYVDAYTQGRALGETMVILHKVLGDTRKFNFKVFSSVQYNFAIWK